MNIKSLLVTGLTQCKLILAVIPASEPESIFYSGCRIKSGMTIKTEYCCVSRVVNNKIPLYIIFTLIFNFSFLIFNSSSAYADSLSLSISPPLMEVMIRPGKSVTQKYKIVNHGEIAIITPRLVPYSREGTDLNAEYQKESWISFLNADVSFDRPFFLDKGAERQLTLRINPPSGTPEQDYYRVILFVTAENPGIEASHSSISQSIGSILLVNVTGSGLTKKEAQIAQFELPQIVDSWGPVAGNIEVKNSGSTYFRSVGEITLTGPVTQASFQLTPQVILKDETRKLLTEMSSADNSFQTFNFQGLFLGRYELKLNFQLDESNIRISQTKSFVAFPWKLSLLILILTGSAVILRKIFKFSHSRKK